MTRSQAKKANHHSATTWRSALCSAVLLLCAQAQAADSAGSPANAAASAPAASENRAPLTIPRAAHAPRIADYIGRVPADAGLEISDFRQYEPGDGSPASKPTRAYLSFDDEYFYAVFVCQDDPKQVRARIARREDLPGDDAVILDLDTFHDRQRSFRFYVNPYGVQMDARHTEGPGPDFNFDTQWQSDGRLTDDGYVVTLAIPFKSLRFKRGDSQEWGISLGRITARLNEFAYWPYITKRREGFVPQFATVLIPAAVSPGRNIQINPYLSHSSSRNLNDSNPEQAYFERRNKSRAGVDAKFVLADAFALDLTLNPDFSEVESDEPQVAINQRYEVQFPEKRPFFLENAGFFSTPNPLFFSRRIFDPKAGARLTGRSDAWSLGALLIDDKAPGRLLPENHPDYGKNANIAVARAQRDFAEDSNVGVLLTQRSYGDFSNSVGGLDLRYKINQNWVTQAQAAHSSSRDDSAQRRNGNLFYLDVTRADREWNYSGQYLDISPDFDTALAFLPRTNIRQLVQNISYLKSFSEHPFLFSMGPSFNTSWTRDHDNHLQDWSRDLGFAINGTRATSFNLHALQNFERYAGQDFKRHGFSFSASTEWLDWLNVSLTLGRNQVINYLPAAGVTPFLGAEKNYALTLKFTPQAQWRLEQTLYWNDLRSRGAQTGQPADAAVYRQLLSRTKLSYQHSRFSALRLILDYSNLQTNPMLSGLPSAKRLNSDLQYSYILSPGTTLYAGFTDLQQNNRLLDGRLLPTPDLELHSGRRAYIKFNYLFQF